MSNNIPEIITFGCRLNIYESEIIRQNLKKSGLKNVCVLNTCTVTKNAEKDAEKQIRRIKKTSPNTKIIVTGCAAQKNPALYEKMDMVDKVIGNQEKLDSQYYKIDENKSVVGNIMDIKESVPQLVTNFEGKTRGFIQIQNGCNHRCTFCIIPYARGNSRSTPIGFIVDHIKILVDKGFKEVVLTGVDVTDYGLDLPGQPKLGQMIKRLLNLVPNLERLRLSSIDVAEIDDELMDLMINHERLMPHFHISLQAGDNMILKRMKRRHSREDVIKFCNILRNQRPEVSFGADIIAGFPTETDQMFFNTKNLISEAGLQYLHVFPYSPREGTPASRMPQVEPSIRKQRAKILRDEAIKEQKKFYQQFLNVTTEILAESNNIGRMKNFVPIKIEDKLVSGQIYKIKIKRLENNQLLGNVIYD